MKLKLLLFILLFTACGFGQTSAQQGTVPVKDRIVVLISLDGFSAGSLDDPKIPLPTLRRLASEGVRAQSMIPINPTVTWPNHTSIVTGVAATRHGLLYNGRAVRSEQEERPVKVEPWVDKDLLVTAPTVYDLAHKSGLKTAEVDWVAIQNATTIDWSFAERPQPSGGVPREMVQAGLITADDVASFASAPITWRDDVWLKACLFVLQKYQPNLMLFHLLNTDSVQHRYGARSLAANTALAYADSRVQAVLDALSANRLLERSTVIVVSDHGFKSANRTIRANALLRREGLLKEESGKTSGDAYVVPEGGTAMVYIKNDATRVELTGRLKELFSRVEGVERVITPPEYAQFGYPDPKKNAQMADLVLAARDGYSFSGGTEGDVVGAVTGTESLGNHGYLNTDPEMRAIFVAWGRGIRRGARLEVIRNVDVAPTIAALLGLQMEGIEGRALSEIIVP